MLIQSKFLRIMYFKRIATSIVLCIVGLCMAEGILRVLNYPYIGCKELEEVSEYYTGQYDVDLGWIYSHPRSTITPWDRKTYTFNVEGYRVKEVGDSTDYTKPTILIIGDSFLFGNGLNFEETFGYKLQQKLKNTYNVINFAVQGYGLDQAYLRLQKVMPLYTPRYVIVDIHEDQDYRNANWDRRSLFPCSRFVGTKPMFVFNHNQFILAHRPERFETFDNPRLKLLWNRFQDVLHQKYSPKIDVSRAIYQHVKTYVREYGAQLFEINYLMNIRDYQIDPHSASASAIVVDYGKEYTIDSVHPNDQATSKMVDDFMKKFSSQIH